MKLNRINLIDRAIAWEGVAVECLVQ